MTILAENPSVSGINVGQHSKANSAPKIVEGYEEETPTASHELADESANVDPEDKGASQLNHDDIEVRDLGFNENANDVPQPVVGGLRNDELWTLIRRFNKQTFHVKSIEETPLANLDMNIADDEEFSPDKLRAQVERLYVTVAISLFGLWKHVVRLRSWREYQRTSVYLSVYLAAWLLDILVPTLITFLMVLILYAPSRDFGFPPAPPALIDSKTGGVKKPPAGVLATDDTITGAPEKQEGEAAEKEAHSFVNSIGTLVVSTTAGKHPQGDPHDDSSTPDPTEIIEDISNAKDTTGKGESNTAGVHDMTKKPVSEAVWVKARPTMHALADIADTWERFSNALSPTPPFPTRRPRLTLAACLLPLLLGSFFTTSYMMLKGLGFVIGFVFFGEPILTRTTALLERTYPRWQKYVELRNSILRGVPTNAQLTMTLLRIGERNKAPVPPPPASEGPPPVQTNTEAIQDLGHLAATEGEVQNAASVDVGYYVEGEDEKANKPKKGRRIVNAIKSTVGGGINVSLIADKAKAAVGAHQAKDRRGVVKSDISRPEVGPVRFQARYKGQKGHAYVTVSATSQALSWTSNIDDVNPAWTVSIAEINELKKIGGLGWKSKIVVAWALDKQIVDGLVIQTKRGDEFHLTAIMVRDELFNRLIAMGNQMWEAW